MPEDLVFVRHGESEGNVAYNKHRNGDNSYFTKEFLMRHSSSWRLSDRGIQQAKISGEWIKNNILQYFDRYYSSEYLRAMETAGHMNLPMAQWFRDFYLRERDFGDLDYYSPIERQKVFQRDLEYQKVNDFFWIPPNGESMAQLCLRADRFLNTLHRECPGGKVIVVCHGDLMWAFRIRIERLSQGRYIELKESDDFKDRILNGQVLHYTRRIDPDIKDPKLITLSNSMRYVKSICPNNLHLSKNTWEEIVRPTYSSSDLLSIVNKTKRIIDG
jgi:NAD+ kinase